jgi:phosphatidylinositol-3-phosphatase
VDQRTGRTTRATRARWVVLIGVALVALVACAADPPLLGSTRSPTSGSVPAFSHVAVVVLENETYDSVLGPAGATTAPYLNRLAAEHAVAEDYSAIGHQSLGNYLGLVSGQTPTWKQSIDCPLFDCTFPASVATIGDQLDGVGRTWKAYLDGMVRSCQRGAAGQLDPYLFRIPGVNTYATRHNPFVYFGSITSPPGRCAAHDVPYPRLAQDLTSGTLPDFSLIVPDLCNDGHDADCGLRAADRWASRELPELLDDPGFRDGGVLFITFDEAADNDTRGCCGTSPGGGRVATIVVSPKYGKGPGFRSDRPHNHYSLLRTVEDAWSLDLLGHAGDPGVSPMSEFFHTPDPGTNVPEAPWAVMLPVTAALGGLLVLARRRRTARTSPRNRP